VAQGQQASDLPRVVLPHPLNNLPEAVIRGAVHDHLQQIIGGLTAS